MRSVLLAVIFAGCAAATPPYRFLLVAGNQWDDPASFLIERSGEFQITAALLKTWGLPFDVMRLDQQLLDRYHLLERDGSPRYGTIIWDAADLKDRDVSLLADLNAQGVSVVVLGDTIRQPDVARLAGLRYVSDYKAYDQAVFDADHFITRPLVGREKELLANVGFSYDGIKVVPESAKVIARRGAAPFITVVEAAGRGRVAWLGIARTSAQLQNQLVRDLLKRALVWAQGYAVYAEYDRALILFMDDWGTSDKTYLPYWHYKTPTEDEIRTGVMEPLRKHHAVIDMNVNTGFVDRKTRRIVNPWKQRVVDAINGEAIHDFGSTKRGLDAGVAAGFFFIQSHGWTHMLPDLESPPGPFWDARMDGIGSLDWYNEFGDAIRKHETPAVLQRLHMARSIDCIREDFGIVPQVIRPGGGLYSKSPANNTSVIAASMGFGLATWNWAVYLGKDLAISLESVSNRKSWEYEKRVSAADMPFTIDAPAWLGFHDRDLSMDHAAIGRLLDDLGSGIRYMNGSEYSAYLHANIRQRREAFEFVVDYDDHYCGYFASHPSRWVVHLSDDVRRTLGGSAPEKQTIEVPKGVGSHVLWHGTKNEQTRSQAPR
jgi:peptidoglycan/xylan/chitin deacetylase (PgdA/CDA1 family)